MASSSTMNGAQQRAERAAKRAASHPAVVYLGRFGYAAKGIVYAVIGILAVQAAFGRGGATTSTTGALQKIAAQPFGQILLGIVTVGLIGYVIWRFVQAGMDTENKGTDAKGVVVRIAYAISGMIDGALAYTALRILLNAGTSSGNGQQGIVARVLSAPLGRWLVGIGGAIVIGIALYEFYRAYTAKFREKLKLNEMSETERTWATRLGQFGLAARGVVLGLIGFFVIQAAIQYQPSEAQGTAGALQYLQNGPWGGVVLAIVAVGFIAYGIFLLFLARYRRMILG